MVIKRKVSALLVALGIALGVVGLMLSSAGPVAAQSATRSLPQSAVAPGSQFDVTVAVSGVTVGQLAETLPAGFSYVDGSVSPSAAGVEVSGQVVTFTLLGFTSITYSVTASDVSGPHDFGGDLSVLNIATQVTTSYPVHGDDVVTVEAAAPPPTNGGGNGGNGGGSDPSASRSVSPNSVQRGGQAVVTVDISNASVGQVVETLPSGFSYMGGSVNPATVGVEESGQDVSFTLLGHASLSYTVTAGDTTGDHTISGVLKVLDVATQQTTDYPMDDTTITVEGVDPNASRSISPSPVDPGAEATVTIDVVGASVGQVVETLPAEFGYVSGSASPATVGVEMSGQDFTFTLLGHSSFSYKVTAPDTEDTYTFSGVLKVLDVATQQTMDYPMAESSITVETPSTTDPDPGTGTTTDPGTDIPEPSKPTRTPRPAAPPSTPVAIEIVSDVTMAEGATVVQPDASSVVSSSDGMATVMLPNTSRARTYQVMVSSDAAGCSGGDLAGAMQACVTITSYDAEGSMESGVMLIRRATVVMTLDAAAVDDLGGLPVVFQANALGAFSVYQRDDADDSWGMRRSTMGLTDDGGIAVTVTSLRSLGSLALAVDEDILQTAMYQVAGITPTPVVPPTPVATAAPTAVPTAVPTPVPTAVPPEVEPEVGDTTLPVGLLVVLALTGALMVYTGSRVIRRKPATTRR